MSNDFKAVRAQAAQVQGKLNEGQNITPDELEVLRRVAQANPNVNTVSAYAIGKRLVQEGGNGNEAE